MADAEEGNRDGKDRINELENGLEGVRKEVERIVETRDKETKDHYGKWEKKAREHE